MATYVSRTLTYTKPGDGLVSVSDDEILTLGRAAIVLAEPGMGKTDLMRHFRQAPNTVLRSASAFVDHPDPKALVANGETLLIDGLDELGALKEGDPINRVLRQLIAAGAPNFVLSCRVADWRSAIARQEIAGEYGEEPIELRLAPFSTGDAISLLTTILGDQSEAEALLAKLEERGLEELYGNPLTLTLFGEIAQRPEDMPQTRASLYARACGIMWNERNDRQERSALNQLDETTALDAAGAISAAIILCGVEAVARTPSAKRRRGVLDVAEVATLPGAEAAAAVLSSRLFTGALDADAMRPIHRSVAEYLGARWLVRHATNALTRARLMAAITVDGAPPASLRGIHAWLAHFSPELSASVITNDPYGMVRYGDADGLSVDQARRLLEALQRLQETNPHFRAEDWGRHVAAGLAHVELTDQLRSLIVDPSTKFHLRSLLLEAISGSEVVKALAPDLRTIMLCEDESKYAYRERHVAAASLLKLRDSGIDWSETLGVLAKSESEDSTRLALELMDEAGYGQFSAELIATAVLNHIGVNLDPELQERRSSSSSTFMVSHRLDLKQIEPVLDAIVRLSPELSDRAEYEVRSELTAFIAHLIVRLIASTDPAPEKLLAWLRITPNRTSYSISDNEALSTYLRRADAVRRSVQRLLIMREKPAGDAWHRIWRASEVYSALGLSIEDVVFFLGEIAHLQAPNEHDVALWRELAAFSRRVEAGAQTILDAARPFVRGDADRQAHLENLAAPVSRPEWEIKEEERQREAAEKKEASYRQHRQDFSENIEALKRGELRWALSVARSYFALFSDTDRTLAPAERIEEWLGEELRDAALVGLHAVLGRDDLPTLEQIVASYAESRRWNFIHPMLASLQERINRGEAIDQLGIERLIALRIALHHEYMGDRTDVSAMTALLDQHIRSMDGVERYARLLVEPYLERRAEHISGLHGLLNSGDDRATMALLVEEWLSAHDDVHRSIEREFVDFLSAEGAYDALAPLAKARLAAGQEDEERHFAWQSTLLLADFAAGVSEIGEVEEKRRNLFWHFRHRFGRHRQGEEHLAAVSAKQLEWVIRQFRAFIRVVPMPMGSSNGDTNDWDATIAMRHFIDRLAGDPSDEAALLLQGLAKAPKDEWTDYLLSSADQQRSARREVAFAGVALAGIKTLLSEGAPGAVEDLRVIVLWALTVLQTKLHGSDTDLVDKYYEAVDRPQSEDVCTDRLIEDMEPLLAPFGIGRIPQRDMPGGKRADVVFTAGKFELPVECKGQWNAALWSGATDQLDALYLRDWRAADRGLYLVYWFGTKVETTRTPRAYPGRKGAPQSADELKQALIDGLAPERRSSIAIEVLDFTR